MNDTEKITINLNAVDLGKIDLLVQEGLYSNRTDLIRTAIRNQIDRHSLEVEQAIVRYSFQIGVINFTREQLEKYKARGEKINTTVIGSLQFASDIPPELAMETIASIRLRGVFDASADIKTALADRMK
jgi:Arc/MetJ-type ribon-helix-helix transcriptional regulator